MWVQRISAAAAAAAAKSPQWCPTLCDPIDGSPRGSPVPGILQARIREDPLESVVQLELKTNGSMNWSDKR